MTAARNYLEIGVNDGRSLAFSRVPSIAIDPAFKVTTPLRADIQLARATSDAYFAGKDPLGHLKSARNPVKNLRRGRPLFADYRGGTTLDLAFIDGMHLFEYALRDFTNVERFADWSSVIVFDDMLPRNVDEAARDRHTGVWTGDVYKVVPVLQQHRPDLTVIQVDTEPTGMLSSSVPMRRTPCSVMSTRILRRSGLSQTRRRSRNGSPNGCTPSSPRNCWARRLGPVWQPRATAGLGAPAGYGRLREQLAAVTG